MEGKHFEVTSVKTTMYIEYNGSVRLILPLTET